MSVALLPNLSYVFVQWVNASWGYYMYWNSNQSSVREVVAVVQDIGDYYIGVSDFALPYPCIAEFPGANPVINPVFGFACGSPVYGNSWFRALTLNIS